MTKPRKKGKSRPSRLRCFVGIQFTLHYQIQALLTDLNLCAEDEASKLRIAAPGNLHITLKFLGSVKEEGLDSIQPLVEQFAARHNPFDLNCTGIGIFKNSIWIGVESNDLLTSLVSDLNQAFLHLGYEPELKPYTPHITLARFGKHAMIKLSALQQKYAGKSWGTIRVDKIRLYKSDTRPEGARHTILKSYALEESS